jgi:membrane fusion protein, multidrug efflux system
MVAFSKIIAFSLLFVAEASATELVRGVVRPVDQAVISTELNARVLHVTRREGETFKKGDLLLDFDCEKYRADLRAARAEERVNASTLQNSIELERRRAIGTLEVVQNRARTDKAQAMAEGLMAKVNECEVRAPFAGTMGEVTIHPNELAVPNQPLFRIFNSEVVEIELIVPSAYLAWLRPGAAFSAKIDETNETLLAEVARISAAVDPVSQTVKIMGKFSDTKGKVLPGMSVAAQFGALGN